MVLVKITTLFPFVSLPARNLKLNAEQKCDIAQRELEELKEDIEKLKDDSERILDNYKVLSIESINVLCCSLWCNIVRWPGRLGEKQ